MIVLVEVVRRWWNFIWLWWRCDGRQGVGRLYCMETYLICLVAVVVVVWVAEVVYIIVSSGGCSGSHDGNCSG